jgi:transposase
LATLTREQIVTIEVLQQRGQSQSQTARILGVSEGAVRYHLRRAREGAADGRQKPSRIEQLGLAEAVAHWWQAQAEILGKQRPPSVQTLQEFLRAEYGYNGSYKSVRKFVRARYGRPPIRPSRRVETPAGAQTQSDWGEFRRVDLGDPEGPTTLYAFVMVLSHSRKEAVVWSRSMDQLAWHHVHNEAYRRLGGVAAVNRIDYVPGHIIDLMCPTSLCGRLSRAGFRAGWTATLREHNHQRDSSHFSRVSSSRQTTLRGALSGSSKAGSQARNAASLVRSVISAYRFVVSRLA